MMDVSDGLVLDASRLAAASDVSIAARQRRARRRPRLGAPGGEDHALLATFPPTRRCRRASGAIGRVQARGEHAVLVDGRPHERQRRLGPLPRLGLARDRMTHDRAVLFLARRPEDQGVPSAAIARLVTALDAIPHVHTLTVVRHGHVVAELRGRRTSAMRPTRSTP